MSAAVPANLRRALAAGAVVELYDLDYSVLMGTAPGTDVVHFVADLYPNGTKIALGGQAYDPLPIRARGFEYKTDGAPPRPTIEIANVSGLISSLIDDADELVGARLVRRRIFARHLDAGADPDPLAEWRRELLVIERKVRENRAVVEFELAAPFDTQNVQLPLRRVEPNLCPFLYKGPECQWVPVAGRTFDVNDNPVALGAPEEDCGLRVQSCKIRFQTVLRFGGYPGSARTLR